MKLENQDKAVSLLNEKKELKSKLELARFINNNRPYLQVTIHANKYTPIVFEYQNECLEILKGLFTFFQNRLIEIDKELETL